MGESAWRVDNEAHLLHFGGRTFRCDRDIEASAGWKGHVLLLSSDTDCLSLWDGEGMIRTTRVGVYPQDVAVQGDAAYVCGGADGKLHVLSLPDLHTTAEFALPGMPERLCLWGSAAYVLTLLVEPDVHTVLLSVELDTGCWRDIARFEGIPEGVVADGSGLWVMLNEGVVRLRWKEIGT